MVGPIEILHIGLESRLENTLDGFRVGNDNDILLEDTEFGHAAHGASPVGHHVPGDVTHKAEGVAQDWEGTLGLCDVEICAGKMGVRLNVVGSVARGI